MRSLARSTRSPLARPSSRCMPRDGSRRSPASRRRDTLALMKSSIPVAISFLSLLTFACNHLEEDVGRLDVAMSDAVRKEGHPLASCVFCADVGGRNDVKKLCPASVQAWNDLVACACSTACAGPCGADWCARVNDVAYTNASDACNDCSIAACAAELSTCSSAM